MDKVKHDRQIFVMSIIRRMICTFSLTCFGLGGVLAAQVTVSGNGSSGTNGFTVTSGIAISGVTNNDTMWSDSTDGRWKVNNHTAGPQVLGVWPCRASLGGIVYAGSANTFSINPETCLGIGASGQILTSNGTAPSWSSTPTLGASGTTGTLSLVGSTSGTAVITPQAAAGTPTITLGINSGTPAVTASSPLAITTSTGNITCSTCMTTSTSVTAAQMPALTGDCTSNAGAVALNCDNLLIDYQKATAADASVSNGTDVAVYSTSVSARDAGHGIHIEACLKHSTGSTSSTYKIKIGTSGSATYTTGTGAIMMCINASIMNDPGSQTSQQIILFAGNNSTGTIAPAVFATASETWTGALTVSVTQNASGSADKYTGEWWKIYKQ